MKLVYFTHSLRSCWNHGNAHFLRGVLSELVRRGHEVIAVEPEGAWSVANLLADAGEAGVDAWRAHYPELAAHVVDPATDPLPLLDGADAVIVHEWNEPALVARLGAIRAAGARFTLLFHDTHHRAVSDPDAIRAFDLSGYDGVLAFGETLSEVYRRWGWGTQVWTWHEAADTRRFFPPRAPLGEGDHAKHGGGAPTPSRQGVVWIGNWGDGERTAELEDSLLRPAREAGLPLDIYGVRYPDEARALLAAHGANYRGWLPNPEAPAVFARHLLTVHVPRRFYRETLPGIPTIRVFEALACGIPLVSAPWNDSEGLFTPGEDFLVARDGAEMTAHMHRLREEPGLAQALTAHGLRTIEARHSCAHRIDELMTILATLRAPAALEAAA